MEVIVLPWKDPSSNPFFSWIYIILFGAWGGLVRYLLDVKSGRTGRDLFSAVAQIIVSGFTGVLSGLMSQSLGSVFHTTLAVSGISGAMGVVALNYYWEKISGESNDKS
ncbi:phage holin family protein [Enterobacter sichuanensis]|nr:phage holin family protein [Enterobacter sichuanensis]MCU6190958.1 phage holin family protein [Enterobacter sichuanensis]